MNLSETLNLQGKSIYWCPHLLQIIKFLRRKKRYILSIGMGKATNSYCQKAHKNVKMHSFYKKHTYQQPIKFSLANYHYPRNYWWNFKCGLCNHSRLTLAQLQKEKLHEKVFSHLCVNIMTSSQNDCPLELTHHRNKCER